jgi:hypothetical protein
MRFGGNLKTTIKLNPTTGEFYIALPDSLMAEVNLNIGDIMVIDVPMTGSQLILNRVDFEPKKPLTGPKHAFQRVGEEII